ncbi:MAG: UDP-N-acetylglucosamine 2-epimerase (non-hydrolyzing) [Phycisphaerae bacterium]|nr:UDP-N-acetylglucosamine 2-epimerase (non-hydrolyzing) [Phycisphaerae bacterium]
MKRVLVVFGTRPEAIKLAPVIHRLRDCGDAVALTVCSTGQHREMLDDTMRALALTADLDLRLMQAAQHPTDLLGRLMLALRPVLEDVRPDVILAQGDTTTVMASALAGFLAGVTVGHVEAGLRTRDKRSPFPEEINRRVAGVTADLHFTPTARARDALLGEGVPEENVYVTGNTVVDALQWIRRRVAENPPGDDLDLQGRRLVLVTAHRRESFGGPFRELCEALREIAERFEDVELVYPVHLNPNVQKPVREILGDCRRVRLIEPLPYDTFVTLLVRAYLVLTDSGGIQEEAPALGKPVLVLREKTERPEAVAAGVVRLVGTNRERIVAEASRLLSDASAYAAMAREVNVYGDGRAGERIVEVVTQGRMFTAPFEPSV